MAAHRRGPWSQAEDAYLMTLVQTQGPLNWVRIAQTLGSRTPKQCRERYHQNLKPTLNHDPITAEEGLQIERLVHEIGKRWAEIARRLNGRSDNAVKNWWNGSQNRRKRLDRRRTTHPSLYDDKSEPPCFSRPVLTLNPPLPRAICTASSPLSPPYYRHGGYSIDSPLPSPASSDGHGGDSHDGVPSLLSDSGSSYTTSPRGKSVSLSPVELPPLRMIHSGPPRALLSTDPKLPGFSSLASPIFGGEHQKHVLPPMTMDGPLMKPHLPTAPNSPLATGTRLSLPINALSTPDKDTRMDVAAILG
jgi:Myb-like DNA-binding protein FlbD